MFDGFRRKQHLNTKRRNLMLRRDYIERANAWVFYPQPEEQGTHIITTKDEELKVDTIEAPFYGQTQTTALVNRGFQPDAMTHPKLDSSLVFDPEEDPKDATYDWSKDFPIPLDSADATRNPKRSLIDIDSLNKSKNYPRQASFISVAQSKGITEV